jgi:hypothetical protein
MTASWCGTFRTCDGPFVSCSKLDEEKGRFLQMAEDFGWLNPHLSLVVIWNGERCVDFSVSNPAWEKWRPCDPTSPHWYDKARLRRLMSAYIARDQDHGRDTRTVREFVSEFRGLSGSAKQKLVIEEVGASRLSLSEFFGNALASDQLVAFIERKFDEHGVKKIIPNTEQLDDVYRLFVRNKRVEEIIREARQE